MVQKKTRGKRTTRKGTRKRLTRTERKQVRGIIQGAAEKKYISPYFSGNPATQAAPVFAKINYDGTLAAAIPIQGTSDTTRIGDDIKIHSIELRLFLFGNTTNVSSSHYVRFIVLQWHQQDTTAPLLAQILLPSIGGQIGYDSMYAPDNRSLYSVCYDRTFTCNPSSSVASIAVHKFIKPKRQKMRFLSGSLTNNSTNSLYYILLGSGISTDTIDVFHTWMIKYTDL